MSTLENDEPTWDVDNEVHAPWCSKCNSSEHTYWDETFPYTKGWRCEKCEIWVVVYQISGWKQCLFCSNKRTNIRSVKSITMPDGVTVHICDDCQLLRTDEDIQNTYDFKKRGLKFSR